VEIGQSKSVLVSQWAGFASYPCHYVRIANGTANFL
jgi:hypothetical protein